MSANVARKYAEWHWGVPHKTVIDWEDGDLPENDLIECGRLVELHFREPGQRKDTVIKLPPRRGERLAPLLRPRAPERAALRSVAPCVCGQDEAEVP